ncbi:hypothetical protein M427DRAFT_183791 [Gonapodya prolifera JEL478]|uniref:Glyoxalase/fosfomycin resistance/dioxygenase domain-containing protein n=1 Tax=Gonapodya prolifera (strain JEL478) TaxID=1344416 RepID=A0A139A0P7_GONPJ|nr:hypothetical protein M427DRAFT_183791 [Gonapodya prolifera JEL478]|eukprot:KXS10294.1 hypothetical protein M427DRAFT_183791 [Gonapodya prolifera JEL478]
MYLYQPADMTMLFKHQCGALHAGDGSYPVHIEIPCLEGKEAATRDFYSKVLGWSWVDMGGYSLWSWDASHVPGTKRTHVALSGGIYPVPSTPKGAQVDLHFTVQNLDDTEALVKAAGGSIIEGLRMGDPKYGYNIQGYDPNGNNIHFMQPAAKEAVDGGESVEKSAAARQMVDGGESVEKSAAAN